MHPQLPLPPQGRSTVALSLQFPLWACWKHTGTPWAQRGDLHRRDPGGKRFKVKNIHMVTLRSKGSQLQVPLCAHHRGPYLDTTHSPFWGDWVSLAWTPASSQTSTDAPSRARLHDGSGTGYRKSPQRAVGCGTARHWQQTVVGHSGRLSSAVPAEGTQHHRGPQPPRTQTVLLVTAWQTIQEHCCTYHQTYQQVVRLLNSLT